MGHPVCHKIQEALRVVWVMASLRCRQDGLLPLRDYSVDGENAICVNNAIGIPRSRLPSGGQAIQLTPDVDPRGFVQTYLDRRGLVVTEDNLVDVYLAEHMGM